MLKGITKRSRLAALAAALAGSAALGGCMTATPYQPATNSSRLGYWDQRIESDRFQVAFAGNTLTSRETVERYLLYRAAELTVQNGFDHFVLVNRDTETRTEVRRTASAFGPGPWGYWNPYWRYYRPRWGWRTYDPFWDDPFWNDRNWDYRTVRQYEAMAEIVAGRGPKPADNVRAFDAREVLSRLGPTIRLPEAR